MKTIIKLSLILLTLLMPVSAMSNPITTQQALQNVMNFLEKQGKSVSPSSLYLQTSSKSSNTSESYYVFNIGKNDGYAIAAGDDCAPTILGYANTGYINLDSIPNNMKEWLEEYSHQIQYMQENGHTSSKSHVLTSNRAAISPLLTTTWGQKDPYNQNCPDFFGYGKCVTGCVATAMAQVMYYHRAQSVTQTTAQIPAYTCRHRWISGSDTLQISVDAIPAGSPINWNNMLDSYGSSATTLQKQAVANLMKYCGASVQMDYANEWNGGSGAYSSDVPTALKTYFNYSNETVLKNRSSYSTNDAWESLIYNELSSLRPVYYSGRNNSAGHAFVCDGYDGNGYYHINWGWSSTSDGYFLLTALDPEEQGTGGSSSGYNQNQAALINAEPKSSSPSNPVLATSISLNKTSAVLNTGETFQLTATVLPSNATNKTVTWTTSNSSVATVSSNGLVTAKAVGNVTITARTTDGSNLSSTCNITISNGTIITFADANVKALCVQNWDTNGDGELSTSEAAAVTSLGTVFHYNMNITSFNELGYFSGLTSIGNDAFIGCHSLAFITIPSNVTSIGDGAFWNCFSLTSITIPESVTSIDNFAFGNCSSLTSILIPSSVTSISSYALNSCSGLASITVSPNNTVYDSRNNCNAIIKKSNNKLIAGCKNTIIPSSVTSIGNHAFYECSGLTSITIPESVTSIDSYAFANCSGLASISVNSNNTVYDSRNNCNAIIKKSNNKLVAGCKNTIIPSSVTSIGENAFYECSGLTSITIPESVTGIGSSAFSGTGLKELYSNITNPSLVSMGSSVFADINTSNYADRTLIVPAGKKAAYQANSSWYPYFGSIVEMKPATSIGLNQTTAEANVGEPLQLIATVFPEDATNKIVAWTSSNSSIASVNSNGLVIANATGSATITAITTDGSNLRATCVVTVYNNHGLQNGEWAFIDDGTPAMVGQSTNDHLFVRMNYADDGVLKTYDNVVSFKAGTPQTVWFWLDDDEIYQNEKINTLTPIAYDNAGHLYNEITYSSFQCDVYLPQGFRIVSTENEDGDELRFAQGDRLPNGVIFEIGTHDEIVVDGITYTPYTIVCSNSHVYGCHFSAKTATRYKNNGALKKDDAPLFGLFIQNDNQEEIEGRLADMIIANQEFGVREANVAGWAPNDYRFIYGTGGNNETQRFQLYNRVALYGSNGIDDIYAGGIYLNTTYKNLDVNETFQLTATVTPDNTTNKAVTWRSSNVNVATVDNNGNVRAISPGTATITATTADGSNLSASCYVTVNAGNVLATSISLNTNNLVLGINESSQLVATVYPSNTTNKTVNWYSSNTSVATVNSDGLVTAIAEGNATIIATTTDGTNLYASCMVSVNILASSISLSANYLTLDVNQTSQLTATIYPTNTTNKTVTWSSSNTAVATVNTDGVVTTISPGIATITATTTDGSNLSATCNVTVVRLVRSISLNENSLSLTVDQTAQLSATVYPSNATNKSVTWKSSNTNVATVSNNGLVTAKASGTATITATTTDGSNLSASCAVTVSSVPVTSISLNSVSVILDLSNTYTYQLVPTIIPSNATNKTITWKSSNSAIATVSSTGLVTAKAPGSATITATTTDGTNLNASCQVTVIKRATGITLNNSSLTLTLPETARLVATITPNDATTQTLNWTSSNTSVATVDANGLITTKAIGTTTIKASTTDGSNLSASCLVTVKKQYINSITLNVETLVMHIGDTFQLIADVQPENASNTTLNWSTGNSSVASVDNNGLVTAVAGGTTYIIASATDGSNTYANCTIEVLPDYYLTLDTLSHIRGSLAQIQDLPVSLINKNPISGIQFDVKLPNGVDFNYVDDLPDVWLDENRATRTHSISANKLSNGNYRVLVTSSASKDLRGNDGVLVHMNILLPQIHNTGNSYINISNIIASESDETRHTLNNTSTAVRFYYIVGDADANAVVDIADHASTASKILGYSPTPFYNDAANVDGNNSLDVVDLVGITNIALEIRPISIRQAPRRVNVENRLFCDKLHLYSGGEKEISIGIDCSFDFAGFQMDMKLPHGLTLMGATLSDEASKLSLATQAMPDGTIRILGTSFSDASVNGVCPQLLTLRVRAENNYHSGSQIEFSDILFAERDLTAHCFDSSFIEYIEPSTIYELMDEARIYVENGNIIVDTPIAGTVQLIAIDGRMIEYQAHVGHNVYPIDVSGVYIIHFLNKTIKVLL